MRPQEHPNGHPNGHRTAVQPRLACLVRRDDGATVGRHPPCYVHPTMPKTIGVRRTSLLGLATLEAHHRRCPIGPAILGERDATTTGIQQRPKSHLPRNLSMLTATLRFPLGRGSKPDRRAGHIASWNCQLQTTQRAGPSARMASSLHRQCAASALNHQCCTSEQGTGGRWCVVWMCGGVGVGKGGVSEGVWWCGCGSQVGKERDRLN